MILFFFFSFLLSPQKGEGQTALHVFPDSVAYPEDLMLNPDTGINKC